MLQIPAERVLLEYAEAVNRADGGWLEFLCAPDVSFASPESGLVFTGPRPVAEALIARAKGTSSDGSHLGLVVDDGSGTAAVAASRLLVNRRSVVTAPG